jgi:PAS domain S-box-containing protein
MAAALPEVFEEFRILILEDNPADRELLEFELRSAGYQYKSKTVENKSAYTKALQDFQPDIILSDYDLPGFTGAEALKIKKKVCPDIPFILITGAIGEERAIEMLTGGATDYILKRNLARFIPAVQRALHEAYEHRKRKEAEAERDNLLDKRESPARNINRCGPKDSILSLSSRGGEMEQRIRAFDWSKTPLGPLETWSPALRTMTSILLANRFPMILWWGPDSISIYNDAYIPVLGVKHPESLGLPVRECWSEIYNVLRPLILMPLKGGPPTWSEDLLLEIWRHGFLEETHWTGAYSPVPDETAPNGIGGVLATVHEITVQILGKRRNALLRDLGSRSGVARTVEEACTTAASVFMQYTHDVPFALTYLIDRDRQVARLTAAAGIVPNGNESPLVIDLKDESDARGWPIARAVRTGTAQLVEDLGSLFTRVPRGPWPDLPQRALVLLIESNLAHHPAGALVIGLSPRLEFDASYRDFLNLVSSQMATSIANAWEYEEEKKRAEALAEIYCANAAFFSNISYEFRTPLALMLGPIEDLLSQSHTNLPPAAKEQLEVVNRNSLHLLRLVNTLLDFSRIEAGRVQARFEPTDLARFTIDLASNFRAAMERAGLNLIVDCPQLPEEVYVDQDMWEKIVLNLISNAFKFTFEGEIDVRLRVESGNAVLTVHDTGVGIPAEEMPRVFERFHRVQNTWSRTHEGSGIGLALVQELVKIHGGSIRVESRLGEGTSFILSVPLGIKHLPPESIGRGIRKLASTALLAAPFVEEALRWVPETSHGNETSFSTMSQELMPIPSPPSGLSDGAGRPRVLIADDNADMRNYLARLLSKRYNVETVPDGEAVLATARECAPDLILSDVMMPKLDGFGVVREIRADSVLKTIPVILLSACAGEEACVEGLQHGADDYLIKPFRARELLARISAHLEMARMRRESNAQIAHILESIADAFVSIDKEWRYTYVNEQASKSMGKKAGEFIGRNVWESFPEASNSNVHNGLQRAMIERVPVHFESFHPATGKWYDNQAYPLSSGISVFWREIPERKRTEASLRRLATVIMDNDEVTLMGMDGPIQQWNEAAREVYGYTEQDVIGMSLFSIFPDDKLAIDGDIMDRLRRGDEVESFETQRRAKDGQILDVLLTVTTLKDEAGRPYAIATTERNITERKQAELEKELLINELSNSIKELDSFTYSVSHDLRAPLRAIEGFSAMLEKDQAEKLDDEGKRRLKIIQDNVKRMNRLIDDLLALSRISRSELNRNKVDMNALAKSAWKSLLYSNPGITADLRIDDLPKASGDGSLLMQVFSNLLSNAAKYTGKREIALIEVGGEAKGKEIFYYVKDNGAGFDMKYYDKLFGVFQRLHSESDYEGTGVGLAIVQRIIHRHGGRVWAEGKLGKGATFYFSLPKNRK